MVTQHLKAPSHNNFFIQANLKVRATGLFNFQGAKILLPSTFDFKFLEEQLVNYDKRIIIELLKYGFPLGVTREVGVSTIPKNHKGATEFPNEMREMLDKELESKATIGPFTDNPLPGARFSPLN